jgi:hypothetical protein
MNAYLLAILLRSTDRGLWVNIHQQLVICARWKGICGFSRLAAGCKSCGIEMEQKDAHTATLAQKYNSLSQKTPVYSVNSAKSLSSFSVGHTDKTVRLPAKQLQRPQ